MVVTNIVTFESILKAEIMDWCCNNLKYSQWHFDNEYRASDHWIEFRKEEDAVLFKLTWC